MANTIFDITTANVIDADANSPTNNVMNLISLVIFLLYFYIILFCKFTPLFSNVKMAFPECSFITSISKENLLYGYTNIPI